MEVVVLLEVVVVVSHKSSAIDSSNSITSYVVTVLSGGAVGVKLW